MIIKMEHKKSTELLIPSDSSMEEIYVPALNLSKSVDNDLSVIDLPSSSESRLTEVNPTTILIVDPADIHHTQENIGPVPAPRRKPVPAARKPAQPVQTLEINKKDREVHVKEPKLSPIQELKDSLSQDSELHRSMQKLIGPPDTDNEKLNKQSKTKIGGLERVTRKKFSANLSEIKSIHRERKAKIKKRLFREENEETTSFIIENENSENVVKDYEAELKLSNEEEQQTSRKNRRVSKKEPQKSKSKKDKRKSAEETEMIEPEAHEKDVKQDYDYKQMIGICLHGTSSLRFDSHIKTPRIRISIYDLSTGKLILKSNPMRNAVVNHEPTNVDFILPLLSNECAFKNSAEIECTWNDELLIINEDIHHIQTGHVIMLFELVDILIGGESTSEMNVSNGWYHICWAFLKPSVGARYSSINKKCRLQLFDYHLSRTRANIPIYEQWKLSRRKYPAILSVTVGSYEPDLNHSVSLSRPMSVLDEEITGDICSEASDTKSEELDMSYTISRSATADSTSKGNGKRYGSKLLPRLAGQTCKCPNKIIYKHQLPQNAVKKLSSSKTSYGSLTARFSPNGNFLAFHCFSAVLDEHDILVMDVTTSKIISTLRGHLSIIYDIDWFNEHTLVSVSSDRTAIVWSINHDEYTMTVSILPHPSFVYAVQALSISTKYIYIATGGRDHVLRLWKMHYKHDEHEYDLCQELKNHQNYITALKATKDSKRMFSSDWDGNILEWLRRGDKKATYQFSRKVKSFSNGVIHIEIYPFNERLYVQCNNDTLVHCLELTSGIVIQSWAEQNRTKLPVVVQKHRKFAVSVCGSLVFTTQFNEIHCWNYSNDQSYDEMKIPFKTTENKVFVSGMHYHPTLLLMVCSIYGEDNSTAICLMSYEYEGNELLNEIKINDHNNENELEQDLLALQRWHRIRQNVLENDEKAINTFDKILDRIDNLFKMAIKNPNRTDDYKQKIQEKVVQEKLKMEETKTYDSSESDSNQLIIENIADKNKQTKKDLNESTVMYDTASNSTGTFVVDENTEMVVQQFDNSPNTSSKSNHTFKVISRRSDETYEIEKDEKQPHESDTSISDSVFNQK